MERKITKDQKLRGHKESNASAEKGLSMLRRAQHERKMVNLINSLPVRPELVEG